MAIVGFILKGLSLVALPIIRGGVSRGLSSRAINALIKTAFGTGIRRQALLDIIRAEKGIERAGALLKFLPRNKLANPLRMPGALTRIRRQYSFVVRVVGQIAGTGEKIIQNITIATDTNLSRGILEDMAAATVDANQARYGFELESVMLISAIRAGKPGTL